MQHVCIRWGCGEMQVARLHIHTMKIQSPDLSVVHVKLLPLEQILIIVLQLSVFGRSDACA